MGGISESAWKNSNIFGAKRFYFCETIRSVASNQSVSTVDMRESWGKSLPTKMNGKLLH